MGNISFGVKLLLTIDLGFDFPGADCFDNRWDAFKEIIFIFGCFDAVI